jgi:hypothetical protein
MWRRRKSEVAAWLVKREGVSFETVDWEQVNDPLRQTMRCSVDMVVKECSGTIVYSVGTV